MGRLANKNILITGGNSGIGLAAAQEFDREGSRVAICGLNEGSLQAAKKTLGVGSLALRADVSNLTDLDTMFATIKREFGHLDGESTRRFSGALVHDLQALLSARKEIVFSPLAQGDDHREQLPALLG